MHKRGFLLTSLIVGASILVWLTIIGLVITGVAAYQVSKHDTSSTEIVPLNNVQYDDYGVPCSQSESQSGC